MSKLTSVPAKELYESLMSDEDSGIIISNLSSLGFKQNTDYNLHEAITELRAFLKDTKKLSEKQKILDVSRFLVVELCRFSDEIYKEVFDGKVEQTSFKHEGTKTKFSIIEIKFLKKELDEIRDYKQPTYVFSNNTIAKIEYFLKEVGNNHNIKQIDFHNCNIDDEKAIKIAKAIKNNPHISYKFIGGKVSDTLFTKLKKNKYISLTQTESVITINKVNPVQELTENINNTKDQKFVFKYGDLITNENLEAIGKNTNIKRINFRQCNINDETAITIATAIEKNQNITEVDLSDNQIGDKGAEALATAIEKNHNITKVYLPNNQIGDKGAEALATAIEKNQNITGVYLPNNQIGDKGAEALATAIEKNQNIKNVLLLYNKIGDKGAEKLKEVLLQHRSIIYFTGIRISQELQDVFDFNYNKLNYIQKYKAERIIDILSKNFPEDKDIKNQQKSLDAADKSLILDLMQNPSRLDILMDQKVMGFKIKGKLPSREIFTKEKLAEVKQNLEEKAGKIKKSLGMVENPKSIEVTPITILK